MGITSDRARGNTNRNRPHHPKETIERARALWDIDGLSASAVAARVGLSRGAICAIAHRNDFQERPSPIIRGSAQ